MAKLVQLKDKEGNVYPNIYDDGWHNISSTKGTWSYLRYRRIAKMVEVEGYATAYTWSGSGETFAILPDGLRPHSAIYMYGYLTGIRMARMYIATGGGIGVDWVININNGSNYTSSSWLRFHTIYFID